MGARQGTPGTGRTIQQKNVDHCEDRTHDLPLRRRMPCHWAKRPIELAVDANNALHIKLALGWDCKAPKLTTRVVVPGGRLAEPWLAAPYRTEPVTCNAELTRDDRESQSLQEPEGIWESGWLTKEKRKRDETNCERYREQTEAAFKQGQSYHRR